MATDITAATDLEYATLRSGFGPSGGRPPHVFEALERAKVHAVRDARRQAEDDAAVLRDARAGRRSYRDRAVLEARQREVEREIAKPAPGATVTERLAWMKAQRG